MTLPYISLTQAKDQLAIDAGLTLHDARILDLIGASIDWAQNYTNRSLAELLILDAPADADAIAEADSHNWQWSPNDTRPLWYDASVETWTEANWCYYGQYNPVSHDHSQPLRRDVRAAILLYVELLFDRNTDNFELLEDRAEKLLDPYRQALGV